MAYKPRPILSDMPWHVKEKIVDFADPATRWNLRTFSNHIQKLVDKDLIVYNTLEISLHSSKIEISMSTRSGSDSNDKHFSICFEERGFVDSAIEYLEKLFSTKNLVFLKWTLRLEKEGHDFNAKCLYENRKFKFLELLEDTCVPGSLYVIEIELFININDNSMITVLECIHPGSLQSISLHGGSEAHWEVMNSDLFSLDQWEQAREFSCAGFVFPADYDTWNHLEVEYMELDTLDVKTLKDIVRRLGESITWKNAKFMVEDLSDDILDYFHQLERVSDEEEDCRKIKIPACNTHVIHITIQSNCVMLSKLSYDSR